MGLYKDAFVRLWRGLGDEWEQVKTGADEAGKVRRRLKREAEMLVLGKELKENKEGELWSGHKAAALHKAFEKLQLAEPTDNAESGGGLVHQQKKHKKHTREKGKLHVEHQGRESDGKESRRQEAGAHDDGVQHAHDDALHHEQGVGDDSRAEGNKKKEKSKRRDKKERRQDVAAVLAENG